MIRCDGCGVHRRSRDLRLRQVFLLCSSCSLAVDRDWSMSGLPIVRTSGPEGRSIRFATKER